MCKTCFLNPAENGFDFTFKEEQTNRICCRKTII